MRVKVIILIALAVLLIVSSVDVMASNVLTQGQPQSKISPQGLFAYPVYSQQNTGRLQQFDGVCQDMLDISKDMYDSRGSGLLSKDTVGIPFVSGESIPGPMDLISAFAPAGYASNISLGNHSVKNSLIGTGLL